MKSIQKKLNRRLSQVIKDASRILTEEAHLYSYSYDASFGTYLPDVVVQPIETEEVVEIMKIANELKVPVYPRGQATGLSGGALPVYGGIVLDLTRFDHCLVIDPENMTAIVSPGVITGEIDREAAKFGLMYPPDPSSANICTIGGNLAENAGGPRGLKYGVTKDYVLGLEVVTAEGQVINTGGQTIKNVTGYNLTQLFVGSEGTLGIITEAILRLIPRPLATETMLVYFKDFLDAGRAISQIMQSGIVPAKLEIMDQASIQAVESYQPMGLATHMGALLLIELDGHPEAIRDEMVTVRQICQQKNAHDIHIAKDTAKAATFWQARKLVSPAIVQKKPTKVSEDATVPRSKIPDMFARLMEIKAKFKVDLVVFGHAGDGNLHPNIIADQRNREEMRRVERAVEEIFQAAIELGGTLSGEHGIGTLKSPFLPLELDEFTIEMMQRIKQSLDPNNLLNPGKIFPKPGERLVLTDE